MTVFLFWCIAYFDHSMQCLPPQRMQSLAECHIVAQHLQQVAKQESGYAGTAQCLTINHK